MFYERIISLCGNHNITITALLKTLEISPNQGTQWKRGSVPSSKNLTKIAEHFNVSTDYLLGNDDIKKRPTPEGAGLDDDINQLIQDIMSLPPAELEKARDYVELLKNSHRRAGD